jgi:hypothetical protein
MKLKSNLTEEALAAICREAFELPKEGPATSGGHRRVARAAAAALGVELAPEAPARPRWWDKGAFTAGNTLYLDNGAVHLTSENEKALTVVRDSWNTRLAAELEQAAAQARLAQIAELLEDFMALDFGKHKNPVSTALRVARGEDAP